MDALSTAAKVKKMVELNKDSMAKARQKMFANRSKVFSDQQFNENLEQCFIAAMDSMHKEGGMPPSLMIISEKGEREVCIIPRLPDTVEEREAAFTLLGAKMAADDKHPYVVYYVTEAWAKVLNPEEAEKFQREGLDKPIRHMADKKEVLTMTGYALDGRRCTAMAEVVRTGDKVMFTRPQFTKYDEKDTDTNLQHSALDAFFDAFLAMRITSLIKAKREGK